jgi:putative ABC transport system permease protein
MFLRLVADSVTRRPRQKLLTTAALSLGMAVATAALSVSLDVGDRLAREFRSLGANLLVTPQSDSLPLEIGGVDYRPVNAGAYLPESDLPKLKTIFWRNNIVAFAPLLETYVNGSVDRSWDFQNVSLLGTWASHSFELPDGGKFETGIARSNPWWRLTKGRWFRDIPLSAGLSDTKPYECVVGKRFWGRSGRGTVIVMHEPKILWLIVGVVDTGGSEDDAIIAPIGVVQQIIGKSGQYRKLYVSALTKPQDDFGRRDPKTMKPDELERWSCSPYVSSIAYSIEQVLPGAEVRVIRRVAEGEGRILTRVRILLWLVTLAALLAAALAVGASSAASVIERRTEIGLMKALGAGSGTVGFLLAAEQLLLAFVGGGIGYALGILLARVVGEKIFGTAPEPSLLILVVIIGLAAGVTLLGSAMPLRRASRYEPAPILRGE